MPLLENAAFWVAVGLVLYTIVYRTYGKWYDRNVMQADPAKPTPAHTYMDGVEFFPTKRYVLMGFHSKTVTALGPVVGPIIAIQWGWFPALLWLLIGNIFIGWMQDYSALIVSAKSEGSSYGPLSYQLISPRSRTILLVFLAFYLILITAAFGGIMVPLFSGFPTIAVPTLSFAIAGPLSGYMVYRWKQNVVFATVVALIITGLGIAGGIAFPVKLPTTDKFIINDFWLSLILLFSFLGAVLPIWKFMQPINYLLFYLVTFALLILVLGFFGTAPDFQRAPFVAFFDPKLTPAGPLWPVMFVTIACGAISGWHGLISSSLSAKQLDYETDARPVGGAMMHYEGIVGITSLAAVAILAPADVKGLAAFGQYVVGGSKMMGAFGFPADVGKAYFGLLGIVLAIAITMAAVRIARFVFSELLGGKSAIFKNRYLAAFLFLIPVYFLTADRIGATWVFIFILFGGANQLLAALGLFIITLWLVSNKRPAKFAGIPMVFMAVTTIGALAWVSFASLNTAFTTAKGLAIAGNAVAGIIGIILIVTALVMIFEASKSFRRIRVAAAVPPTGGPAVRATEPPRGTLEGSP